MNLLGRDDPSIILAAPSFEPYTSPALITNLVFRVVLGIIANLICLVPLRLLYRHGEFAAVVFILNVEVKNLLAVINALIWSDDNMSEWWPGHGFCDANYFIHNFSLGLYATCLLAIIRNLAHQVGMLRANPLTVKEKRQRNIIQALIMFPFPIIQLGFTWFLTAQRYAIGTLIGCSWVGYGSWPYLVFFVLAPVVVALLTAGYAGKPLFFPFLIRKYSTDF
jgi:pheromone a factor receptor